MKIKKTGDYWQDLNNELHEILVNQRKYPTVNQRRDMTIFLMHVLESEDGITENDLRKRTRFNDRKFSSIKNHLTLAGIIQSEISYGTIMTENEVATIKPAKTISHLTRKLYYDSGSNCSCGKREVMSIPDNATITQRGSASIITIPDREDTANIMPEETKYGYEKTGHQTARSESIKTPKNNFVYRLIINKAQINRIRELFTSKGKAGIDLGQLFKEWGLPYSEETIGRLKMYLDINNVDHNLEGCFPKVTLIPK